MVCVGTEVGCCVGTVRAVVGDVEKEGLGVVALDEIYGVFGDHGGVVSAMLAARVFGDVDELLVVATFFRPVALGLFDLGQPAFEFVEAVFGRYGLWIVAV